MVLRGINFGHVWQASGATNFFGQGWWYHHWLKLFGLDFGGATFVAKTTTLHPRKGNMPLKSDGITPKELLPRCIHVNRKTGAAVNAVGLSGPGLEFLLNSGKWQRRREPFFISLMSFAESQNEMLAEFITCVDLLDHHRKEFQSEFGIQVNLSCPNLGVDPKDLIYKVGPCLSALGELDVPIVAKFGPDLTVETALEIEKHPALDAFCVFNTLPWDKLPDDEKVKYFGQTTSPLVKHLGEKFKGGVSGAPLFHRLRQWILTAREAGLRKPINAGGGILGPKDAYWATVAGADGISLGSIAFLAPTEVKETIRAAKLYCANAEGLRNQVHCIDALGE